VSEHKPSRWLYLLTAGVLFLGTLLVVVGTRNSRDDDARAKHARQDSGPDETCPPVPATLGLLERGATLQRMECAGCHSDDRREIGPSYQVMPRAITAVQRSCQRRSAILSRVGQTIHQVRQAHHWHGTIALRWSPGY